MNKTIIAHKILSNTIGKITSQSGNLQILMYHRIQSNPIGKSYLPIEYFKDHISYLKDNGYTSFKMCDLIDNWELILRTPKSIILTFDDAWSSQVDIVLPLLKKNGFVGTFFVPTAHINSKREKAKFSDLERFNAVLCSWKDICVLEKEGMEIGGHAHSHFMLSSLSSLEIENELETSKNILFSHLKNPIVSFAYPFGKRKSFNNETINLVRNHGYKIACTSIWGRPTLKSNNLMLPRIGINGYDDINNFKKKIYGMYDYKRWIHKYL